MDPDRIGVILQYPNSSIGADSSAGISAPVSMVREMTNLRSFAGLVALRYRLAPFSHHVTRFASLSDDAKSFVRAELERCIKGSSADISAMEIGCDMKEEATENLAPQNPNLSSAGATAPVPCKGIVSCVSSIWPLRVLLSHPFAYGGKKYFQEVVDPDRSLMDTLRGCTIVEFPTVFVAAPAIPGFADRIHAIASCSNSDAEPSRRNRLRALLEEERIAHEVLYPRLPLRVGTGQRPSVLSEPGSLSFEEGDDIHEEEKDTDQYTHDLDAEAIIQRAIAKAAAARRAADAEAASEFEAELDKARATMGSFVQLPKKDRGDRSSSDLHSSGGARHGGRDYNRSMGSQSRSSEFRSGQGRKQLDANAPSGTGKGLLAHPGSLMPGFGVAAPASPPRPIMDGSAGSQYSQVMLSAPMGMGGMIPIYPQHPMQQPPTDQQLHMQHAQAMQPWGSMNAFQ
jgi:hypothetical protein